MSPRFTFVSILLFLVPVLAFSNGKKPNTRPMACDLRVLANPDDWVLSQKKVVQKWFSDKDPVRVNASTVRECSEILNEMVSGARDKIEYEYGCRYKCKRKIKRFLKQWFAENPGITPGFHYRGGVVRDGVFYRCQLTETQVKSGSIVQIFQTYAVEGWRPIYDSPVSKESIRSAQCSKLNICNMNATTKEQLLWIEEISNQLKCEAALPMSDEDIVINTNGK